MSSVKVPTKQKDRVIYEPSAFFAFIIWVAAVTSGVFAVLDVIHGEWSSALGHAGFFLMGGMLLTAWGDIRALLNLGRQQ